MTLRPSWLNRDLAYLFTGRGLRSLAQGYLAVIVPLYLAHLGYSAVQLGLVFSAAAVSSAGLAAGIGFLSDRYGRKLFLVIMALFTAAGGAVFAVSGNFIVLLVAGALSTFGRGGGAGSGGAWGPYYVAEQPLLAEHASDRDRTAVFGAISFVGVLTGAVGSLIATVPGLLHALFHVDDLTGDRGLFAFTIIVGIAMALIVLPVREERDLDRSKRASHEKSKRHSGLSPSTLRIVFKFMLTNATNGLAVGFLGPITVYWFYRRFGVDSSALGGLFFVINLATAPSYLYASRIASRLGAVRSVVIVRVVSVVLLGLIPLMPVYPLAAVLLIVRMATNTLSNPIRQSYLMGVIPREERASAAGLSNLPSQVMSSLGPTAAGYLMDNVWLNLPLELAAVLQGVNAALYFLFFRNIRPPEELGERRAGVVADSRV